MRSHNYGPRERSKFHYIDLYSVNFEVVVSGSIQRSRLCPKRVKLLGPCIDLDDVTGLQSNEGPNFSVFFTYRRLSHEIIAHEIFHATHRIMEWVSAEISPEAHEPHAYLNGHLTKIVYQDLKDWKVRAHL